MDCSGFIKLLFDFIIDLRKSANPMKPATCNPRIGSRYLKSIPDYYSVSHHKGILGFTFFE